MVQAARPTQGQFENNYFTEMCSGSEAGSYLRLIDLVYHSSRCFRTCKRPRACTNPDTTGTKPDTTGVSWY